MNAISRSFLVLSVAFFKFADTTAADIIVSYAPSTNVPLVVGSGATLDVFIRSSDGTDTLDGFLVELALIPTGGAPIGGLQFVDPQADEQLSLSTYVFDGRSLSSFTGAPVGAVSGLNTIFSGYDATDDGSAAPGVGNPDPVLSLATSNLLLFRLELFADTVGDYELHLTSASFFSNQLDPDNTLLTIDSLPSAKTLTVTGGIAAVPEPGTLGLLSIATAAVIGHRVRRRRLTVSVNGQK